MGLKKGELTTIENELKYEKDLVIELGDKIRKVKTNFEEVKKLKSDILGMKENQSSEENMNAMRGRILL